MENYFPMVWQFLDLDKSGNWIIVILIRFLQEIFCTNTMLHPDEYWQSTEPAYKSVFGDV